MILPPWISVIGHGRHHGMPGRKARFYLHHHGRYRLLCFSLPVNIRTVLLYPKIILHPFRCTDCRCCLPVQIYRRVQNLVTSARLYTLCFQKFLCFIFQSSLSGIYLPTCPNGYSPPAACQALPCTHPPQRRQEAFLPPCMYCPTAPFSYRHWLQEHRHSPESCHLTA